MEARLSKSGKLSRGLLFFSILLITFLLSVWAHAASVSLSWNPNTEIDLAGYKIHYGTASGSYTNSVDVGNVTTCTIPNLTAGQTYYFAATAYDTSGSESGYSNQVSYTIPTPNAPPATPAVPSGEASALINTTVAFSTSASDPNGDALQYRYDWGGGAFSNWGSASQSHSWSAAGSYAVKAQARDSQLAESAWSNSKTVTISEPAPAVVDPPEDPVSGSSNPDAPSNDPAGSVETDIGANDDPADTAAAAEHPKPEAPVLVSPVSDAVVNVLAVLETDSFKAAENGAAHAKTRWQVFRDEDDSCVLDIQSTTALTRLAVPKLVLDEGTPYFWRAQFIDADGTASMWSDYEYFVTAATDSDLNANGILDDQEVGSSVDLDKDGVKDNRQATIKSVKMEGTRVQIGVSIKGCPTAIAVESVESEDPRQPDAYASGKPRQMPFGLINFKIAVANPGDSATVKLHFSEAAPARSKWFKYDPIADQWYDFSSHAKFAQNRRSITLSLQDGGAGDADGIANGVIIDPAGVVELSDTATPTSSSGASSGGGGGGCFIGSLSSDYDDMLWATWAGFLLMSMLVLTIGPKHRPE